ncbi:MAG: alpha/beta fold hydrolase, partial [Acidobacteriota bacterium]
MKYRVLGPLEVLSSSGDVIAMDSPKQRMLLAALIAHSNQVVSAERLAEMLWGEDQPADPAAALQTHVSRLRRNIRSQAATNEPLTTESFGYRLAVEDGEVDAHLFETSIQNARRDGEPQEALQQIERALDLWRGEPFAEFSDLEFAHTEKARLEELFATALEIKADCLLSLSRYEDAIAFLETVISRDPLRERPRALLMQALSSSGRQADALGEMQEFRRLLSEELGIGPSPSLLALERSILAHEVQGPDYCAMPVAIGLPMGVVFEPHPVPELEISYCDLGDNRRVAIGSVGEGEPIVIIPAFVTNLSTIAEGRDPRSGLIQRLSETFRVILYDRYGTGLSSGDHDDFSTDAGVGELVAVLDHLHFDSVPVIAMSCAGPIGLTLAARFPERPSHLILLGTYADGPATFRREDLQQSMLSLVRAHWGIASKIMADMMFAGAGPEIAERFARMQKEAATPEVAALCLEELYRAD